MGLTPRGGSFDDQNWPTPHLIANICLELKLKFDEEQGQGLIAWLEDVHFLCNYEDGILK